MQQLLDEIEKVKNQIKDNPVFLELCQEYDFDPKDLELVPMCFDDLPVSARTQNGIIYFNYSLLNSDWSHYLLHEFTHFLQQTSGTKPTEGANAEDYLDNKEEQEGFQNQTEYLAETKGEPVAVQYITQVLDHHKVPSEERTKRYNQLLDLGD